MFPVSHQDYSNAQKELCVANFSLHPPSESDFGTLAERTGQPLDEVKRRCIDISERLRKLNYLVPSDTTDAQEHGGASLLCPSACGCRSTDNDLPFAQKAPSLGSQTQGPAQAPLPSKYQRLSWTRALQRTASLLNLQVQLTLHQNLLAYLADC